MRMHATTSCMFVCIHLQVHRDTPPTSVCTCSNECNLQQAYLYTFAQMHAPTCMHLCVHAATHAIVVGEFVCLHVQVCALVHASPPASSISHSGNTCFCMHAYTNRCKHLHACLHCQTHTLACISTCMQQHTQMQQAHSSTYTCRRICSYACISVHAEQHMRVQHVHLHACINTCMHQHVQLQRVHWCACSCR